MIQALSRLRGREHVLIAFVCLLCTLPYWRAFALPPISDTYLQIWLGRKYLHFSTWPDLAADSLYRCRATSIWLTGAVDAIFGFSKPVILLQSLTIHALNVAALSALGRYRHIGYRISIPMALFWGLQERHHEAVIWYASLPEQLVFLFVILNLVLWLEWWQTQRTGLYIAALASFCLALLSKESAVVASFLILIPLVFEPSSWRRALLGALPYFALSALYFAANMAARDNHLHWNDGTFRLGWHFIPVLFNSTFRLFSLWGILIAAVFYRYRQQVPWKLVGIALLWIPLALGPYAFVAYQPRVPSRHVYLAFVGVALLLSIGAQYFMTRRKALAGFILVYGLFNCGYIWFYKHDQFMARANVTEQLIQFAKAETEANGLHPLRVSCFPLAPELATIALNHQLDIPESWVIVDPAPPNACPLKVESIQE